MSDVGGEVSGGEVSGSEVSEAEMSSDVSQGEMDNDLSQEVDECYDSYMNGDSEIIFDKNTETNEVNETDQNKSKNPSPDNFESELNKKTDSYLNEKDLSTCKKTSAEEVPAEKNDGLTETEREIREQSPYSEEINKYISSVDELNIYIKAGLHEEVYGDPPKSALVRDDIDMHETVDHKGRDNAERIAERLSPITKDGDIVELHHIGQYNDSPYAELTMPEHRGKESDLTLHDKNIESEIDRDEFSKEKHEYWEDRRAFIEDCENGEFD